MLIEEMFKTFTKNTMEEPMNKSKKNHDLCVDVYSKTNLIDITAIMEKVPEKIITFNRQIKNNYLIVDIELDETFDTIDLPFENCFLKIQDKDNDFDSIFCFIREYSPSIYTGALCFVDNGTKDVSYWNKSVFTIKLNPLTNRYHINSCLTLFTENKSLEVDKETVIIVSRLLTKFLSRTLLGLKLLTPKHSIMYYAKPTKTEYLRKKLTKETIKVQRPIYIYTDKKEETLCSSLKREYKNKQLERNISWNVRGHWRRLDSINKRGKDSSGKYVIEGFTWVVPHKCGKGDVSNKTYIAL